MDRRRLLQLWRNKDLVEYIRNQARRHFSCKEDQEDAAEEAWEKIAGLPQRATRQQIHKRAYQAIHNMYERARRRRVHIGGAELRLDVHG